MLGLVSVLAVLLLSLIVTRVATIALTLTGMSRESARFQARSAMSGVGFTTSEAESVVSHPVRRRIVLQLMLVGSAGVVTAIASLFLSFGGATTDERARRGALLVAGLFAIWMLARSSLFDRAMRRVIAPLLRARGLHVRDYGALLHLGEGYDVGELSIEPESPLAGRTLRELALRDQGVAVLGINRAGAAYEPVPSLDARVELGDTLFVYGHADKLAELGKPPPAERRDRVRAAEATR